MGKRAVEPLIAALKNEDPNIRGIAARILGEIKNPLAVEPLIAALKDKHRYVRRNAAEAPVQITGKDFDEAPDEWRKWWEQSKENVRDNG